MDPVPNSPPPAPQVVHHYHAGTNPGTAVLLEVMLGIFVQTFGVGNMYAGNVAGGLFMMFGYWALQVVNVILVFLLIGIITLPLTWVAFMIFCPMVANNAAKRKAYQEMMAAQAGATLPYSH